MQELVTKALDLGREAFFLASEKNGGATTAFRLRKRQAISTRPDSEQDKTCLAKPFERPGQMRHYKDGHPEKGERGRAETPEGKNIETTTRLDDNPVEPEGAGGADERAKIPSIGEINGNKKTFCPGKKVVIRFTGFGTLRHSAGTAQVVGSAKGEQVLASEFFAGNPESMAAVEDGRVTPSFEENLAGHKKGRLDQCRNTAATLYEESPGIR